jgi:cytochrome bd-type quinol oxidase subunit 2
MVRLFPKTTLGKWSTVLIIVFLISMVKFYLLIYSGQRGGETFFSNPTLSVPILIAGGAGITAFFTGIISILKQKERSVIVFITTAIGFVVLFFALGEILFPH